MQTRRSRSEPVVVLVAVVVLDLVAAVAYRQWALLAVAAGLVPAAAAGWRRSGLDVQATWQALAQALRVAAMALAALTLLYVVLDDTDLRLYGTFLAGGLLSLGAASLIHEGSRSDADSSDVTVAASHQGDRK